MLLITPMLADRMLSKYLQDSFPHSILSNGHPLIISKNNFPQFKKVMLLEELACCEGANLKPWFLTVQFFLSDLRALWYIFLKRRITGVLS